MYGYNIHSGMPTMHGGLTGHGMSSSQIRRLSNFGESARDLFGGAHCYSSMPQQMHSLGGYLLGGAGISVKGKKGFQKKVVVQDPATGEMVAVPAMAVEGVGSARTKYKHRKPTIRQNIKNDLGHLYRAEEMGARELSSVHPMLAKYLENDAIYNEGIYNSERLPAYTRKQFGYAKTTRPKAGDAKPRDLYYLTKKGKVINMKEGSVRHMKATLRGDKIGSYEHSNPYFPM